jgi:hypothetical protein
MQRVGNREAVFYFRCPSSLVTSFSYSCVETHSTLRGRYKSGYLPVHYEKVSSERKQRGEEAFRKIVLKKT